MKPEHLFFILWLILVTTMISILLIRGRKALQIFPDINSVRILFREKYASGTTTHKNPFKRGAANRTLDVIVTDSEVWIKTFTLAAGLAQRTEMLQKLNFSQITGAEKNKNIVAFHFMSKDNKPQTLLLKLKNPHGFMELINGEKQDRNE